MVDVSVTGISTVPPKPTASPADNVKAGRAEPHARIAHGSLIGLSSGNRKESKVQETMSIGLYRSFSQGLWVLISVIDSVLTSFTCAF